MPIVGARLRDSRQLRQISQRELARRCGLGENSPYVYENNKGDPSIDTLIKIAKELRVSTDYLLGLSEELTGHFGDVLRADEQHLLEAYNSGDSKALFELITDHLKQLAGES